MRNLSRLMIVVFSVLFLAISGCVATPTPMPTPEPTPTPFVMPQGDFEMSWNLYDSEYNSLGGILTIRRQGSSYTSKLVMSDGSSATYELTAVPFGKQIRLYEDPDNSFGDYMYISIWNGSLNFCDNQGFIYSVPLLD